MDLGGINPASAKKIHTIVTDITHNSWSGTVGSQDSRAPWKIQASSFSMLMEKSRK